MVKEGQNQLHPTNYSGGLVVGNYCHDVLIRDNQVIGESLGGAASFVSNVLDGLSIHCDYISKVGYDFSYSVSHLPLSTSSSKTTLFHAYFSSIPDRDGNRDRVLKRIHTCEPIFPSDLPNSHFEFGLAVGVAGEILPETLERMLDICRVVFVDIQALIRVFDPVDGTVKHVGLRESGFSHLLSRIGFLKASAEEAPFIDIQDARKCCSVVVTDGKDGCRVYWKNGEMQISPFPTIQIDPTGAGDSFLGALVAGLNWGLPVPDAALLGNFFGSLTVGHIGLPKFELWLLQRVKDMLFRRKSRSVGQCEARTVGWEFKKAADHEDLQASLAAAARLLSTGSNQQYQCNGQISPGSVVEETLRDCSNCEQQLVKPIREEPGKTVEDQT